MTTTPTQAQPDDIWSALDYTDPVALLAKLRPAYYRLIAGEAEAEIEATDRRRVRFAAGNVKALAAVIADLEKKIAVAPGRRSRFALAGRMR